MDPRRLRSLTEYIPKAGAAKARGFGFLGGALALAAVPITTLLYNGIYNVEAGHKALVFNKIFGLREIIYTEGTIWRWPWLEEVVDYDVRIRTISIPSLTGSKDLQMVNLTLRVFFAPHPDKLVNLYRTLSTDFDQRVLPSLANEVSKAVVAQYTVSQLVSQRDLVSSTVKERLQKRAFDFNIIVDDVNIPDLTFGKEYSNAVEAKQVAQQQAEQAKYIADRAEQEKHSIIIRAQGEAAAAEMLGKAVKANPSFIQLRTVETARSIAGILANSENRIFLPSDMLLLDRITQRDGPKPL